MINKSKNTNLQLTISKDAYKRFLELQSEINNLLGFELSKSQLIEYMIINYNKKSLTETNLNRENAERDRDIYMKKIRALKDALNISYARLSDLLNIPIACVKNYGTGKQTPNEKNKIVIDNALKHYNIKIWLQSTIKLVLFHYSKRTKQSDILIHKSNYII